METVIVVVLSLLIVALSVLFIEGMALVLSGLFRSRSREQEDATEDDLEVLAKEARGVVEGEVSLSGDKRADLLTDIEVFSAPNGGMPEVLRLMIRYVPSHSDYDISGAGLILAVGRENGMRLSLAADDLTGDHIELHDALKRVHETQHRALTEMGASKRSLNKSWIQSQKDTCFAMEHLNEYPMLLPVVRDRGITDVHEALEAAKALGSSGAPSLSSGML